MEHFRRRSSAESGTSFLKRALNGLSTARSKSPSIIERSEPSEGFKGPLGLNLLYAPAEPLVDFVFVHGLGGGSRKTWSKTTNPYHYWPQEWLPRDPDFKHVRVHSFGYMANWGEKKDSVLEINDFARSLLGEIKDNPDIRSGDTQLVLVGHSMGGLVIKKAYILARQDPAFKDLAPRFHTVYFLATPHRGSDLARTLTNILKVTYGQKLYVNQLEPNSVLISSINDTFRHYAQDLQLWSFYETLQSSLVVSDAIIVDKASATLGYPHERTALLNADHRGVCKFDQPSDTNYRTLRNAFSSTVDVITHQASLLTQEATQGDLRRLSSFLGVSGAPEDDLLALENARIVGSCEWLTSKKEFEEWRVAWSSAPSVLWLSGNPASGKSVLACHVVGHLARENLDCSYFFFKRGITTKSSISHCLRSLAYQTALSSVEIRRRLLLLEANDVTFDKDDERAIWRKLFLGGVLQANSVQPYYCVIDALDECNKPQLLLSMISKLEGETSLRVFVTSRKNQEMERAFDELGENVKRLEMLVSDTVDDIGLFISARMDRLPVEGSEGRANLTDRILTKSNGSFLWVRLVVQELEHTWSEEGVEEVLNELPADMNLLYARTLENMSKESRSKKLAKAILTWTICASRLLTLRELQCALKLDINETVHNLERSITSICGQLVFVDQLSRVQIIHQTARDFLLQESLQSEFAVRKAEGHARLAIKCLLFLSESHFKAPRTQKQKLGFESVATRDFALADYACTFFSDHLYQASSLQSEPWDALYDFLNSNILSWIEHLAKTGDLYYVTRTATNIKAYLERRTKYFPPIGQQVQTVEAWSVDLIRVCAKFRTSLLTSPSSIYWLIPPMCPAQSIIGQKFSSAHRGLTLKGSTTRTWDDCLIHINYQSCQATAIHYGDRYFAVGLSTGKVMIYHSISGQISRILKHPERVKILAFGGRDRVLASSGLRNVCIWDLSTGHQIWCFSTTHQALALVFTNRDESLMAATQGDYVACWSLLDGEQVQIPWHDGFNKGTSKVRQRQPPTHALFSPDRNLLAVNYRGRPILLFDVASEMFFGECVRNSDSRTSSTDSHYPIVAMAFNPGHENNLLIVSYGDGELAVYNPWTVNLQHCVPKVNAQAMACSPDGRTLVTGSAFGTIQLFDFDGAEGGFVTLIYRINAYEEGIKSLTFSNDCLRFIDIRGSQCRVWEPAVLVRKDLHDCDQSKISDPMPMVQKTVGMVENEKRADITAVTCHLDGDIIFCGKVDGSVATYGTHDGLESNLLYKHAANVAITAITWGIKQSILVSADESSRIMIRRLVQAQTGWSSSDIMADQRFAEPIRGLLISPTNDRLLVSGRDVDELWTIQGQTLGSKTFLPRKSRKALYHSSDPDAFVVVDLDIARIYRWGDFEEMTASEGIKLNRSGKPIAKNFTSNTLYQGKSIFTELAKTGRDQASTRLECWETRDIRVDALAIIPLPGFEMLGPSIEHIIAVIRTTLLFLDTDLWVCSLDLEKFGVTSEAKRHFFIPSDWQNSSGNMLFQFTSKNEFVFVKKNELVIIQRGMDYSETISLSRA